MPNMVLVSVFDHAVGEYAPCMCVNSEAAAIRIFTNEVNRYDRIICCQLIKSFTLLCGW